MRGLFLSACALLGLGVSAAETLLLDGWDFCLEGSDAHETVRIPHDWAIKGPFSPENDAQWVCVWNDGMTKPAKHSGRTGGLPVVGTGWYRRNFTLPEGTEWACLAFDGVMSYPEVFVDGRPVASRINGGTTANCRKRRSGDRRFLHL